MCVIIHLAIRICAALRVFLRLGFRCVYFVEKVMAVLSRCVGWRGGGVGFMNENKTTTRIWCAVKVLA